MIADFNPLLQMASGVCLTFFGSFVLGTPGFRAQTTLAYWGSISRICFPCRFFHSLPPGWRTASWRLNLLPSMLLCGGFLLVNATYICLVWEVIDRIPVDQVSLTVRKIMRFRSITTLCLFGVASIVALKYPLAGLGICICCLIA